MAAAYTVYLTDIHKSKETAKLQGVYTTHRKLIKALNGLLNDNDIVLYEKTDRKQLPKLTVPELNNNIDYVLIDVITLNEPI